MLRSAPKHPVEHVVAVPAVIDHGGGSFRTGNMPRTIINPSSVTPIEMGRSESSSSSGESSAT